MAKFGLIGGGVVLFVGCASLPSTADSSVPDTRFDVSRPCFGVTLPDSVAPVQYAADKEWYTSHAPLPMFGDRYAKFGMPRTAASLASEKQPPDLTYAGTYDGVPVYAERGTMPTPRFIYMLVNASCGFQEYAQERELQ